MSAKGLFIPGIFVTPTNSRKYGTIRDAVSPCALDIVDFTDFYDQGVCYQQFIEKTKHTILTTKPDFIITFSFGSIIYRSLIQENPEIEAKTSVMIVPLANYGTSKSGRAILEQGVNPADIYVSSKGSIMTDKMPLSFYADIAAESQKSYCAQFKGNVLSILASQDEENNPGLFEHLEKTGSTQRLMVNDKHNLLQSMDVVCGTVKNFVLDHV